MNFLIWACKFIPKILLLLIVSIITVQRPDSFEAKNSQYLFYNFFSVVHHLFIKFNEYS